MIPMPPALAYWTADEVAECLPYQQHLPADYEGGWQALYARLWSFLAAAQSPTPLGGDGSHGTVETPGERLSLANDDKAVHWWERLTHTEQYAIHAALQQSN
jgi:hypothetical protein